MPDASAHKAAPQASLLIKIIKKIPFAQAPQASPPHGDAPAFSCPYTAKNQVVGDCFATVRQSLSQCGEKASVCLRYEQLTLGFATFEG
jgi:hypothetical protein